MGCRCRQQRCGCYFREILSLFKRRVRFELWPKVRCRHAGLDSALLQVDLSGATAVSVGESARTVRKFESARIETSSPISGIRTASGLPVVAELPRIHIPSSMANADWDVTLHDSAGDVIARKRFAGTEDPNKLWDSVSRPTAGTFTIRVRGPWGRGASRSFTVVEDLSVSFTPGWRRFVSGGLQPCVAQRASSGWS